MNNDIFDTTWITEKDGDKIKISFRHNSNKLEASVDINGEIDIFDEEGRMGFVEGIESYLLMFHFAKDDFCIDGIVVDSFTLIPSNVNYPGNIELSEDAKLFLNLRNGQKLEFKKYVKKFTKLSEIAQVQIGKKLTPTLNGLAMYIKDYNSDRNIRVNECMVNNEHAVFFGISIDNIDFFSDCDEDTGYYCAAENIAVLTNIEHRFDNPSIIFEIQEQVETILKETHQHILTLEQVKNIELDDDKYKTKVLKFTNPELGDFNIII